MLVILSAVLIGILCSIVQEKAGWKLIKAAFTFCHTSLASKQHFLIPFSHATELTCHKLYKQECRHSQVH